MKIGYEKSRIGRRVLPWIAGASMLPALTHAAAPTLDDYSQGITITAPTGQPLVEIELPMPVYQTITDSSLSDVRVFNAEGMPVPHAFCAAQETTPPTVEMRPLSIFQLREAPKVSASGAQIEVQTSAGTQVRVQQSESGAATESVPSVHILDARNIDLEVRAIEIDWSSPDGASEARVRIQASEDLDRWNNVVAASTLLQVEGDGQRLGRRRIELPQRRYAYLRVERADGGAPLIIQSASAEAIVPGTAIEPTWFMAQLVSSQDDGLTFDAGRMAPVQFARLRLPQQNSSVRFDLSSRIDDNATWRERWRGESYSIVTEQEVRASPPARFESTTDRQWRVRLPSDADRNVRLELGYRPARLRFLAQGSSPYTLAYGSRRAEPASPASCEGLLSDVAAADLAWLVAQGQVGAIRNLGGEIALTPLPQKTPVRLIVLWAVLVAGAAGLVAMALSLLRRLKEPS